MGEGGYQRMQNGLEKSGQQTHLNSPGILKGSEYLLDECPFCGKYRHCYANIDKAVFKCHSCGEAGHLSRLNMDNLQIRAKSTQKKIDLPPNEYFPETAFIYTEREGKVEKEILESPHSGVERLLKSKLPLYYVETIRAIPKEAIRFFEIGLSERGTLQFPFRKGKGRDLMGYKYRTIPPEPKAFWRTKGSDLPFFGDWYIPAFQEINEESIYITEGEIDCVTLFNYRFFAVANPLGAGNWNKEWNDILRPFCVKIAYDFDAAGQTGAERLEARLKKEGIKCQRINDFPRR